METTRTERTGSLLGSTPPYLSLDISSNSVSSSSNNVPVLYHTRSTQISEIKRMFIFLLLLL